MAADETADGDDLIVVTVLADPTRRRVYTAVSRAAEPMSRDQVATKLGLPRSTAAFHLERLADVGLLAVEFRRLTGRTGPGSGRPAKVYVRPDSELRSRCPGGTTNSPARSWPRRSHAPSATTCRCATPCAMPPRAPGNASPEHPPISTTRSSGPASSRTRDGDETVLGTCPFHRLARENPAVVCELNHAMLCGMAEAVGDDPGRVRLDAGSGGCCIRIAAAP